MTAFLTDPVVSTDTHLLRTWQGLSAHYVRALPDKWDSLCAAVRQARHHPSEKGSGWTTALALTHHLRGTAGTYGFPAISELAGKLEDSLRQNTQDSTTMAEQDRWLEALGQACRQALLELPIITIPPATAGSPAAITGHILVIDDDPAFLELISGILIDNGFDVTHATVPEQTLDLIEQARPDLILLDIEMPGISGFSLCQTLRGCSKYRDIPIIFVTAYQGVQDRIAAFQAKADDFIGKPIVAAELLARIGVRLEHARLLSERTTMLHRLQTQQQVLLDLLNQLDIGILLLDGAGRIRFSNDTYGRMVDLNPNELVGRDWAGMALFSHKSQEQIQHLLSAPPTKRSRLSLNWGTPDGRRLWAECEVKDNPSDPRERLLLFYDVSELYQLRGSLSNDHGPHMIGTSQPMLRLYQLIEDTARGDWTVLIEGETGTGKELVARSIHTASPRHKGPFIAVNSAGLSESLLSSQLFGHRRGAFTGALADQEGVFEAANGGTLFLDEIGDLPLNMQASLLRVLDQREIVRVGEARPRKVDVRIIAATHKALTTEVQAGRFREDLLFRLRVARIAVPPLRQRQPDIPLLVQAFLHESRQAAGKIITQVSSKAMQYLLDYPWPGNVRELKSCIDYAVIQSRGPVLQPDHLPPEIGKPAAPGSIHSAKSDADERSQLLQALEQTRGNRTRAAGLLGISRATFYRRLIELGISSAK